MNSTKTAIPRFLLILSMLIFGSVGIFRRLIDLPSSVLAACRGIVGAAFLFIFMLAAKKKPKDRISSKNLLMLLLVGAGIGINWVLLFEAYAYTTVSTATLCYYMQPTIVILLSPLIFREKLDAKKICCVIAALIGMVLVSGFSGGSIKGALFGLGAAAFYAAVVIMNKKLSGIDVYVKTATELAGAAIVTMPYILATEDISSLSLDSTGIIMLAIICLVHTGAAYAMYFGSIDHLPIQSVAIIGYLDPVTAMILSALILGEAVTVAEIIGAVLILGATAVSELKIQNHENA